MTRGIIPPLNHWMLQSDVMASEFDQILNFSEIFSPFQRLDPAIVLYASLRNNTRDARGNPDIFERLSEALYLDGSGVYRLAAPNVARFNSDGMLFERAGTNYCSNYNAKPDAALTNVTLSGTGELERVNDAAALAAAGLAEIGNGYAIRIKSLGAAATANVGGTSSTGTHKISAYIKKIGTTGSVNLRSSVSPVSVEVTNQEYQKIEVGGSLTNELLQVNTDLEGEAFFVLNELTGTVIGGLPIITEGTAAQRAADDLRYGSRASFFNQTEGMVVVNLSWAVDIAAIGTGVLFKAVTLDRGSNGLIYLQRTAANLRIATTDGVSFSFIDIPVANISNGINANIVVRWRTGPAELQLGIKYQGSWQWATQQAYDGAFPVDGTDQVHLNVPGIFDAPAFYRDFYIYNQDYGRAWIEENH